MRLRRVSGATLIELLIASGMFLLLLGTIFLLFGLGSRGLQTMEARQTGQNQLAAIRASFQNDLQLSHFYGLDMNGSNSVTIGGKSYRRDAFSAVTRSDWNSPDAQDAFGLPNWDQWVVYRSTLQEKGELLRHVVKPEGENGRRLLRAADQLAMLASASTPYNSAWARVSPPQVLARDIRSLKVHLDDIHRAVEIEVAIEKKVDLKNPKPDVLTTKFYVKPHNTVPTD